MFISLHCRENIDFCDSAFVLFFFFFKSVYSLTYEICSLMFQTDAKWHVTVHCYALCTDSCSRSSVRNSSKGELRLRSTQHKEAYRKKKKKTHQRQQNILPITETFPQLEWDDTFVLGRCIETLFEYFRYLAWTTVSNWDQWADFVLSKYIRCTYKKYHLIQ